MKLNANASLLKLNTLALDAYCLWLAEVEQVADLATLRADPQLNQLPRLNLGGGSNMLSRGLPLKMVAITGCCMWRRVRIGISWYATACSRAGMGWRIWR